MKTITVSVTLELEEEIENTDENICDASSFVLASLIDKISEFGGPFPQNIDKIIVSETYTNKQYTYSDENGDVCESQN